MISGYMAYFPRIDRCKLSAIVFDFFDDQAVCLPSSKHSYCQSAPRAILIYLVVNILQTLHVKVFLKDQMT